ncbi:uncharacterized protein [Ptychodera flava]|uniref:uncharacterized protein n=1 Tax=Ptychodera flava TaxID=63121 RepID=UPI00396A248D
MVALDTIREQIVAEVLGLVEILAEPIDRLKSISDPFEKAYDAVYRLVTTLKEEYENLRKTYDSAKSLLNEIFGIKGTKSFPRKIAEGSCGDGYYPSNIGNTPPGIDLEINVGDKLVAPFTGTVKNSGQTQVTIELSEEMPHTEIVIDHVDLLNDVLESGMVSKGLELGTVTDSGCHPNAIHLAMRRIGTEEYIDPTDYIEKPAVNGSTVFLNRGCDEYLLILRNNVIAGPKPLVGRSEETDENPARPEEPELGDLDHISGFGVMDYKHQGRIMGNSTIKGRVKQG